MSTEPAASSTAWGTKFSEAIISSVDCWRSSSRRSTSAISGSTSASGAVWKSSGRSEGIAADNTCVADDVEAIVATFRLLDSDTYEQALELVDDEFEMVTTPDLASEPDVYRGPEGVRRWWESFLDVMEWVRLEVEEVHRVDDERAILEFGSAPVDAPAGSRPISARSVSPPPATASSTG